MYGCFLSQARQPPDTQTHPHLGVLTPAVSPPQPGAPQLCSPLSSAHLA